MIKLEKGKISPRQTASLLFMTMISTSILFVPSFTVEQVGRDAWISLLFGVLWGLLTLFIVSRLGQEHAGETIFQYAESVLGKWPGKLIGCFYVYNFLRVVAIVIREFGTFMTTSFMPNTPLFIFLFSLAFLAAWAAIAGVEILARMSEFILFLVVMSLVAIVLLSLSQWELNQLLPLFTNNLASILKTSTVVEVWKADTISMAVLIPYMTRPRRAFAAGTAATVSAGLLLVIGVIGALAIFGPHLLPAFRFPIHMFVRTINIGQILTRFEVIVMVVWVAGAFIKTTVYLYFASLGFAQAAELKEYRSVVLPLGVISTVWAISLFANVGELEKAISTTSPEIYIVYLGLPAFLLIVTLVRSKLFGSRFGGKVEDE